MKNKLTDLEKYDINKIIEVCCEFAKFTHDHSFRRINDWSKWKTITSNSEYYRELTDEEMFNYFLEKKYGNKN